jgi:hypothetical protein
MSETSCTSTIQGKIKKKLKIKIPIIGLASTYVQRVECYYLATISGGTRRLKINLFEIRTP